MPVPPRSVLVRWRRRIAAAFRLHGLLRRALRSGAVDRDPPAAAAAAAAILANSGGAVAWLPGWAGLPVCAATERLVRDAAAGWSTTRHWLFHGGFRAAVHTLLLVHERTWRLAAPAETLLPYLDTELWFLVCKRLRREDFVCGPLPALDEDKEHENEEDKENEENEEDKEDKEDEEGDTEDVEEMTAQFTSTGFVPNMVAAALAALGYIIEQVIGFFRGGN